MGRLFAVLAGPDAVAAARAWLWLIRHAGQCFHLTNRPPPPRADTELGPQPGTMVPAAAGLADAALMASHPQDTHNVSCTLVLKDAAGRLEADAFVCLAG
jgi:hypothetical protein